MLEKVAEKTKQIMRCSIPHITKEDSITGADLESVIFTLIREHQQLQDKVESLERNCTSRTKGK